MNIRLRILFLTYYEVTPQKGGIERMTDIVVNHFTTIEKIDCYSAFYFENELAHTQFREKICLQYGKEREQLYKFISDNEINVVVNQQIPTLHKIISTLSNRLSYYYVYFQHDRTLLNIMSSIHYFCYAMLYGPNWIFRIKFGAKLIVSPFYFVVRRLYYIYLYRHIYHNVDSFILLSSLFKNVFLKSALLADDFRHKIRVINNSVTLPISDNISVIECKKREVLIVSRLTEERKRISLALKIWSKYQDRYSEARNWLLRIVGNGEFAKTYSSWVKRHKVPNVIFEGQVNSTSEFYRTASVFMMTSDAEGWGLTLMEAQQMGCVPIAFASYESIYEIIQNDINGILVRERDVEDFIRKLHYLLEDDKCRKKIAINCLDVQKKFSVEKMMQQWDSLLEEAEDKSSSKH